MVIEIRGLGWEAGLLLPFATGFRHLPLHYSRVAKSDQPEVTWEGGEIRLRYLVPYLVSYLISDLMYLISTEGDTESPF